MQLLILWKIHLLWSLNHVLFCHIMSVYKFWGNSHPHLQGLWPNTCKRILLFEKLTFSSFKNFCKSSSFEKAGWATTSWRNLEDINHFNSSDGLMQCKHANNHLKNWIISQKVSLRFVFCFLLVCFLDYFSFTSPVYWKKKPKWKIKWLFQPTVLLFKTLFCRKSI